jgi:GntR family transcriptional repressor for pyruvate dehydrogenase complex
MPRIAPAVHHQVGIATSLQTLISNSETSPRLVLRAKIALGALDSKTNREISAELGVSTMTVGKWRAGFARKGIDGLSDSPRSGRPSKVLSQSPKPGARTHVARSRLTDKLIDRFKQRIADGQFLAGSKLPPERTLALQLGVSRPSLRQALKVMQIMGVLQQRVGDGTYVNANASAIMSQPLDFLIVLDGISFHELVEARMIFEPELAGRAAERATEDDLNAIRTTLRSMERAKSHADLAQHDTAFHEAIFRAAGNRVCQFMLAPLHRVILDSMRRAPNLRPPTVSNAQHRGIYEAIADRNPELAYRRMMEHLSGYSPLLKVIPKPLQCAPNWKPDFEISG